VRKLKVFLGFDTKMQLLLLEAYLLLGWARVLKSTPFSRVAPQLGERMGETSFSEIEANKKVIKNISYAVNLMSRYTIWESKCLVKAIATMKMLERRKVESTLYLGTSKDESGKLIAHAWLRSGPYYLTGAEVMDRFIVVGKFAKRM
jgi:hypothetical protein